MSVLGTRKVTCHWLGQSERRVRGCGSSDWPGEMGKGARVRCRASEAADRTGHLIRELSSAENNTSGKTGLAMREWLERIRVSFLQFVFMEESAEPCPSFSASKTCYLSIKSSFLMFFECSIFLLI